MAGGVTAGAAGRDGPYRVCFVCTGNICRSPMAAVVLAARAEQLGWSSLVASDSAGTGAWHAGERMDRRSSEALRKRGYDGREHRARRFERAWVGKRELLIALDYSHVEYLRRLGGRPEIRLLREFDPAVGPDAGAFRAELEVPDPYFGSAAEFDACLAMIEAGVDGLVPELARRLDLPVPR